MSQARGPHQPITVDCWPAADGWECRVTVGPPGATTEHEVVVSLGMLAQLAPGAARPETLIKESFRFLLEREPRESILPRFALPEIGRYFPEYDAEITRRVSEFEQP